MRFLQASDFHLTPDRPERLEALREVVRRAREERADALLVPGDLFDQPEAAEALRARVRDLLEAFEGPAVIVPGNHDLRPGAPPRTAFPGGTDYGRRTVVLSGSPLSEHTLRDPFGGEIRVVGVPFRDGSTLARDLAGIETDPLRTVLLAHGTLQSDWVSSLAEAEGEEAAYYPILERDLRGRFAYAALGHFHGRTSFPGRSAEGTWGYSGSPVAITRGELGRRHAALVDFVPGVGVREVRPIPLDTPYWEECRETARPWETVEEVVRRVCEALRPLAEPPDPRRGLRVRVDGHLDGDEVELRVRLERAVSDVEPLHRRVELECSVVTVRALLERHPWLPDLLSRLHRRTEVEGCDEKVLRRAAGLLVDAVREGSR